MDQNLFTKYKKKRRVIIAYSIIILLLLYMFKNTSFLVRSLSAICLVLVFYMIDHFFDVDFERKHYVFILCIAVFSFILSPLYFIYPNYDKILHVIEPLMLASISFHFIHKLDLKLKWKMFFLFFIVIGSLCLFEIGEYLLDVIFDLKLQGVYIRDLRGIQKFNIMLDENNDTMIDLSLGVLSTIVYCTVNYYYLKSKLKHHNLNIRSK